MRVKRTIAMNQLKILGGRLKSLRKQVKMTQKDMGDLLGCTASHYQKIEYGHINISATMLSFLADYYSVSADYLLGRIDEKNLSVSRKEGITPMAKKKEEKTNVMRTLEQKKVPYTPHTYPHDDGAAPDGVSVARSLGQDPAAVFKTLVVRGASGNYYVFDIPVAQTLDLKKAAKAVGEKSAAMLPSRELLPLTGYVHGGCSPIGQKKLLATRIDETAQLYDAITFSGGRIGCQITMAPDDLAPIVPFAYADLTA